MDKTTARVWAMRILQILLALAFGAAGAMKLVGAEAMVAMFDQIGFGQWFRYVTGLVELAGAVLIIIPATAFWGAVLLACVSVGAILTHLFLIGGSFVPALILLVLTAIVGYERRPR